MWFIGAGSSRSANMPTATDILWDLKAKHYCRSENQILANHDIDKRAIRARIQSYCDSKGFPRPFSPEEYGFYFDLVFNGDQTLQQQYLLEQLSTTKISLNIGQRAFAALIDSKLVRVVFTTNFDEVVETAFSNVTGKTLSAFGLDGSYGALDALNAERFPLYVKVHGDFRFSNLKNLPKDLQDNDKKLQECFLAASNRFGLIINGYSGRDANVMQMFESAIRQPNAFPHGLIWTTSKHSELAPKVVDFLRSAKSAGVKAFFFEADTFDTLTTRIWRQFEDPTSVVSQRVFSAKAQSVRIPLQNQGRRYPILRTNALPITSVPVTCGRLTTTKPIDFRLVKEVRREISGATITFDNGAVLFWGDQNQLLTAFESHGPLQLSTYTFPDPTEAISKSTVSRAFFEEALATALSSNDLLRLRRSKQGTWFAVISHLSSTDQRLVRM